MSDVRENLAPGEYVAKCPECGAKKIATEWDMEPPAHLHGIDEGDPYLVVWEPEAGKPRRGRPPKTQEPAES